MWSYVGLQPTKTLLHKTSEEEGKGWRGEIHHAYSTRRLFNIGVDVTQAKKKRRKKKKRDVTASRAGSRYFNSSSKPIQNQLLGETTVELTVKRVKVIVIR